MRKYNWIIRQIRRAIDIAEFNVMLLHYLALYILFKNLLYKKFSSADIKNRPFGL